MGRSLGSVSVLELVKRYPNDFSGLIIESGFADEGPLFTLIGTTSEQAGFTKEDITITYEPGSLTVESNGQDMEPDEPDLTYLHKGIAMRKFIRKFTLSDTVIVVDSKLEEGMLTIHLEKHIPDELKPKLIEIN